MDNINLQHCTRFSCGVADTIVFQLLELSEVEIHQTVQHEESSAQVSWVPIFPFLLLLSTFPHSKLPERIFVTAQYTSLLYR